MSCLAPTILQSLSKEEKFYRNLRKQSFFKTENIVDQLLKTKNVAVIRVDQVAVSPPCHSIYKEKRNLQLPALGYIAELIAGGRYQKYNTSAWVQKSESHY